MRHLLPGRNPSEKNVAPALVPRRLSPAAGNPAGLPNSSFVCCACSQECANCGVKVRGMWRWGLSPTGGGVSVLQMTRKHFHPPGARIAVGTGFKPVLGADGALPRRPATAADPLPSGTETDENRYRGYKSG